MSIDHSKIGIGLPPLAICLLQQLAKIFNRGTGLQRKLHQTTVA